MKRLQVYAAVLMIGAGAAAADVSLSLGFKLGATDSVTSIKYDCGAGNAFAVSYMNAGPNALALIRIDGEDHIFVNVVSGSGSRYVAGAHVWWSKGDTSTLENTLESGDSLQCDVQE